MSKQQYELRAQTPSPNTTNAVHQVVSSGVEEIDLALRTVAEDLERQLVAGKNAYRGAAVLD